jgi:lipooligosaccharide transport system permease protein
VGGDALYLFSGTFFAIEQLPGWLQALVRLTPLWHGVDLCRTAEPWHRDLAGERRSTVAYLLALAGGGFALARRMFSRQLHS